MSSFLLPHLPMVNVCMVDFISESLFERTVAPGIQFNKDSFTFNINNSQNTKLFLSCKKYFLLNWPPELRNELESLDEDQIARIPRLMTGEETMPGHPVLSALVENIRLV